MKNTKYILLLLFVGFLTGCNIANQQTAKRITMEITKKCPIKIDSATTLERCDWIPENSFVYYYTVNGNTADFQREEFLCI